jgi:hypothetical protein
MILISRGVYLSGDLADDYANANNPIVGYHNLITLGGISADSETTDYPASNLANVSTAEYWESESNATQYINFELGANTWNYIAFAGHNLVGSIYQFQSRADPGDAWSDVTAEAIPGDNQAIIRILENSIHPYLRMKITPASGVLPKVAVIYVGRYLQLQRRIHNGHTPIIYGVETKVVSGMSEDSNFLGRVVKSQIQKSSIDQSDTTAVFYRSYVEPFRVHAVTKPFFFAWRPSKYPNEVGYCWGTADLDMSAQRSNGMVQWSLTIKGFAPWT